MRSRGHAEVDLAPDVRDVMAAQQPAKQAQADDDTGQPQSPPSVPAAHPDIADRQEDRTKNL